MAPDARVTSAQSTDAGCRRARAGHALLAARARTGTPQRERIENCGFALYHDDASIVVAPQ